MPDRISATEHMRQAMSQYHAISDKSWSLLAPFRKEIELSKNASLYLTGDYPASFCFVHEGLLRLLITDEKGTEYNKNFFAEGSFVGCMTALLTNQPSRYSVTAVEDCTLVEIDHRGFRQVLKTEVDLMQYQISYLEKNWLLHKDAREIALVQADATERYLSFCQKHADLSQRLPQYHIASHLGITPTQLSRIRKNLASDQPM
ncbi:Crp/Fnr family transcriptional regulator [Gilvimarinus sp. SDUM040013]|uniref:Crp/Fnr family transcriptional regulator n=1 Tax=Gilvimarinus gilvus TaxID=3058038 RepID=A0ABU4RZ95_9GAMM|nr:Crp/Fnr family transcriptional regulator [Gilvimarinus sp. SDUM040013]MDO3386637.1 Crp/Fnr family transcriptional regulator [Gilvimarinus sp. SDUM040013]MDX6849476.1 Crp/Fnr family transcriptional regulator [Gilvimarinus sp. SDUM040013]